MRQRGFTLVELVLVIVLLGILGVYAAARYSNRGYDLRAAASELVQAIRHAQQRSMSNSGAGRYAIAIQASGFRVTQAGADVKNPLTGQAPYTDDGWAGRGISSNVTASVQFDARGEPLDAATGNPIAPLSIVLSDGGGDSLTVTLQPVTGYVRIQ